MVWGAVVEGADPLGRGFPLIQVCAEGDRGGQKTDILQLLPKGIVAIRGAAFSLFHFLKTHFFGFPLFFFAFLATYWLR